MTDRIEKTIEIKAPVSRVWRALTDHGSSARGSGCGSTARSCRARCRAARSPIRATSTQMGGRGAEDGARAAVLLRWHPYAIDPNAGLFAASRPRWSSSRWRRSRRHAAPRRRIGLRQAAGAAPRRGVPHERRRLGRADRRTSSGMSNRRRSSAAAPEAARRCSPRSATRRGCRCSAGLCAGGPLSITRLTAGTGSPARR